MREPSIWGKGAGGVKAATVCWADGACVRLFLFLFTLRFGFPLLARPLEVARVCGRMTRVRIQEFT